MPLDVTPVRDVSVERQRDIFNYLKKTFEDSYRARTTQIDSRYRIWIDNYNAVPAQQVRSTPWVGAANFVPQLSRIHTDILSARINGIYLGTRPFWRPSTFADPWKSENMSALAEWMERKSQYNIQLFSKMDGVIQETCKTGTLIQKMLWEDNEEVVMRGGTQTNVTLSDLHLYNVPFYDFFPYPLTAPTLEETLCRHSVLRFSKHEVEYRRNRGLWSEAGAKSVLEGSERVNDQESRAGDNAGVTITTDVSRPFAVVESSFKYQLVPGKNYNLMAVFNPKASDETGLLRLYYSFFSDPRLDIYNDWRIIPRADSFYGISIPEILAQMQEEQAQIHNARRDANTIANVPTFKKKRFSLNNFSPASEWYPGKVWEVDNMDDVAAMPLGGNYNSMIDEERMVLELAERSTGVSQPMQGMGTGAGGKKGTYNTGGTLALLSEGNRRLDVYIKRLRQPTHRLGKTIFTSYRDFGDREEFKQWGKNGERVLECFNAGDTSARFRDMFFDFTASEASANKEVDRQGLLLMSNTMSSYYGQVLNLAQAAAGMSDGTPAKMVVLSVLDGARDLATRILTVFDIPDRSNLVPDVRAILAGQGTPGAQPPSTGGGQPGTPGSVASPEALRSLLPVLTSAAGRGGETVTQ